MSKKKYMICYDISDNTRRNRVIRELLKVGIRTQYSVFEAVLSTSQVETVKKAVSKHINKKEDSIIFYPLSDSNYKKVLRIGSNINYLPVDDIFV